MFDLEVSGFSSPVLSWVPTPGGLTILVTDFDHADRSVRLYMTRRELLSAIRLSRAAERNGRSPADEVTVEGIQDDGRQETEGKGGDDSTE